MFWNKNADGPWFCSKCGSHNVELRCIRPGIPLLGKLPDLLGGMGAPDRRWGPKRAICKDCGHISLINIM